MNSPIFHALGKSWESLPMALQTHHAGGQTTEVGHLDVRYPRFMQGWLRVLGWLGALVARPGEKVHTVVRKTVVGPRQLWRRTLTYPGGEVICFNSTWEHSGGARITEFVNPVLGLMMSVWAEDGRVYYRGEHFVVKLGRLHLPVPEWLVLGHTTITEEAVDDNHFDMDFRLTHPLFGEVFRYAGRFEVAGTQRTP
jgi:hypothetical protein